MTSDLSNRERAIELVRVLNQIDWDFCAAVGALELARQAGDKDIRFYGEEHARMFKRMCVSWAILGLAKLDECNRHYRALIPTSTTDEFRETIKEIRRRAVVKFRNKAVGHIWDRETNRPLTSEETNALYQAVVDGDSDAFLSWISADKTPTRGTTVRGVVQKVRDALIKKYSLTSADHGLGRTGRTSGGVRAV